MRRIILYCSVGILFTGLLPAHAGTKEEIMRLQSDVLALQNQIRAMEKTFGDQMEALKSLVVQLNDQVGRTSLLTGRISSTLESQTSGGNQANQAFLQEIRNLSTKLDDASTRISALAQQVADIKVQANPISPSPLQPIGMDASTGTLSLDAAFSQAYNDLVQGNFEMALQEFAAFARNYPGSDKADDAQYYIGEVYLSQNKFPLAIAAFTKVLTDYPTGDKIPTALFKRGKAELAQQEKENATADFKAVIQRYSSSPEAALAKVELENLGIGPASPKSVPVKRKVR
jgi:tol-pal system protein YbgF